MANRKIGAVIALDGEQQFKSAVTACTRELNTMKSALKLVEAQTEGQAKSLETLQKKHDALSDVLEATRKRQEDVAKGLQHAEDDLKRVGDETEEYRKKLSDAQEALKQMESSGSATTEELNKQKETIKELSGTVESGEKAYERGAARVEDWKKKLNDAKTETVRAEKAVDDIEDEMRELETATDKAADQLDDYGDEAKDAAKQTDGLDISLKSMIKNSAVNLAVDAMRNIGDKAMEAARYVVDVGSKFEAEMDKVSAISGATGGDLAKLTDKAKEMGATTKFSASESAEAFEYMAMAGWKTNDMLSGIDGIMSLAAASGADLATTSDIVTDALTAFGESAGEAGRLADIMAAASSNSNTNVEMMGETFKYAAPVVGALGGSMEDTAVAVGLMANAGIKASQAGTSLRTGLTNLAKPTKQMQDAMDKYNIALVENEDGSVNLRETMISLREKMGGLEQTEQAAAAASIFGRDAMAGWLAVINASDQDFNNLITAIDNSEGAASTMADTMQNNLAGSMQIFKDSLEGLGLELYDKAVAPLTGAVEFATGVITSLTNMISGENGGTALDSVMDGFLTDVKEANDEVARSLENAQATFSNAEAKVGELSAYDEEFGKILEKCDAFNLVTLDTGEKAIVDSSGNIVKKLGEVGTEAEEANGALKSFGEGGINIDNISTSSEELRGMIGYVRTDVDELGNAIGETYVITDEFTKAKITAMVDTLGDSVGDLATAWNKETGELHASKEEMKEWFDVAKDVALYNALKDSIEETTSAYGKALLAQTQAESGYNAAKTALDEFIASSGRSVEQLEAESTKLDAFGRPLSDTGKRYAELRDKVLEFSGEMAESDENVAQAEDQMTSLQGIMDPLREKLELLGLSFGETGEATEEAAEGTEDLNGSLDDTDEAAEEAAAAMKHAAEHAKDLAETTRNAASEIVSSFDEYKKSAEDAFSIDPFGKWEQDTEKGMLAFEEAMQSQIDGMLRYKDNLGVVRDNLGEISPEFVQYLEDMGQGGAQLVAEFADAFRNGDTTAVYRLMDEYKQATDIQDGLAQTLAADKLALITGLAGLSDEDVRNWEDLGRAFDEGLTVIQGKGEELALGTTEAFWGAVEAAKSVGLQVPAGLADSIRNSEDPALAIQEATEMIEADIQGRAEGLARIARELGINVPTEISSAIKSGQGVPEACNELIALIQQKDPDFQAVGVEVGEAAGGATAEGIANKEEDVTGAADDVVEAAKGSASTASELFDIVGHTAMEALKGGIREKSQEVSGALTALLTIVKNNGTNHGNQIFPGIGSDIDAHIVSGISQNAGTVTGALNSIMDSMNTDAAAQCNSMRATFNNMIADVSNAINNTHLSFPNVQIPHVRWTWEWLGYADGGGTYYPNFYVDWYAKAMKDGMILDNPTIFGMMNGKLLGAGEAGSETVVGTSSLMNMIGDAVDDGLTNFGVTANGTNSRLDALLDVVEAYLPQILDAAEADREAVISDRTMGVIANRTSEQIGRNARRLM